MISMIQAEGIGQQCPASGARIVRAVLYELEASCGYAAMVTSPQLQNDALSFSACSPKQHL